MKTKIEQFETIDFLKIIKKLLKSKSEIYLVYAALLMRLGIECRLQEYIFNHEHIPSKCKKAYRLNELNTTILRYLHLNDQIAKVTFLVPKSRKRAVLYYTPVRLALIKIGQKLGNFLHHPIEDPKQLSILLHEGIKELEFSIKGVLMGPPLKKGNNVKILVYPKNKIELQYVKALLEKGAEGKMNVEYLDIII